MKTFKEFQKNSGKLVAGYASIGHYRSIDIPEHPDNLDNIPVGYFSIGNRPEVIIKNQLKEWIYDTGVSKSEYERYPSKFDSNSSNIPNDHIDKLDVLNRALEKHYHPGTQQRIKQQRFRSYTGAGSYFINHFLIAKHFDIPYDKEFDGNFGEDEVKQKLNFVEGAMNDYKKPAPRAFHVYAGVGPGLDIDRHRTERSTRMYLPAFTSTSIDPEIAKGFSANRDEKRIKQYKEVVRLHIPEGSTHGTYLGSAGLGSVKEHEHEFLLDRGHIIQFMGEPRFTTSIVGGNILVHDAKIIRQIKKPILD